MFLSAQTRSTGQARRSLRGAHPRRRLGAPAWKQFDEQVIERSGGGRYKILLRENPFGLAGLGSGAPSGLGPWTLVGPAVVAPSGGTAASVALSSASGASMGLAVGGPIGAGIGAIAGAIAGAWAAHAARAKGATTENAAMNSAVIAFDTSIKAVFAGANSGQITGSQAAGLCQTIMQSYWAGMAPFQTGPGRADASHGGAACGTLNPGGPCIGMIGGPKCNSACTAGCCVGCQDLYPTILSAIAVFNSTTGGSITACNVSGSGYGGQTRAAYTLTYTPPAATTAAGLANTASSLLTNPVGALTSTADSVDGIPLWAILAGAGLAIYLVAR